MVIGNKMIWHRFPFLHHMPEAVLTPHLYWCTWAVSVRKDVQGGVGTS